MLINQNMQIWNSNEIHDTVKKMFFRMRDPKEFLNMVIASLLGNLGQ